MRRYGIAIGAIVSLACVLIAAPARAQDALGPIQTYEFGQSREPLTVVEDMVRASLAAPEERQALATQLAAILGTDATFECKQFICRQLILIGAGENVPAVAALLDDPATVDIARYALERIRGPEASAALLDALADAPAEVQVKLINSLGARGCGCATEALRDLAREDDVAVAAASIAALGKTGDTKAAKALASAKDKVAPGLERAVSDAQIECAARLERDGKARAARRIYKALYRPDEPQRVRVAAVRGLASAGGRSGTKLVVNALESDDPIMRGVALRLVRELPGEKATKAFAKQLGKMPVEARPMMIAALADRGDPAALETVMDAAERREEEVRLAAIKALGALGDASTVGMLAEMAATADGGERAAARRSLCALHGIGVDDTILEWLQGVFCGPGTNAIRAELIRAASGRRLTQATPLLLEYAKSDEEALRTAAFEALGELGQAEHLPGLVGLLADVRTDDERAAAEVAIVSVTDSTEDPARGAAAVLAALPSATNPATRASMIRVLGEIGDDSALDAMREARNDADAGVKDAAVRSLVQWPTPAALDDVLAIAKTAESKAYRTLALRGYVRLLGAPSSRPVDDTLRRYEDVLGMATSTDETAAVLSGLGNVRDPGALRLITPYLEQEELRDEAAAAGFKVAGAISGAYPEEVKLAAARMADAVGSDAARKKAQDLEAMIDGFGDFITAWQVSGPYVQEGKRGEDLLDVAFLPEDPTAQGTIWSVMPTDTNPGKPWLMNLDEVLGGDNRAAYLRTVVVSPVEQQVRVELGSDDGVKVWLNGEVVHANNASRGCNPGDDKFDVTLRKGKNALLLKVRNGGSDWGACARLCRPDGSPLYGLRYEIP